MQLRWSRYREKKFEVQKLVQAKIKAASEKWVSDIRKKDKSAPQKFWNHLKALGTTTKEMQTQIQDGDGNVLLEDSALEYLHGVIGNTFGQARERSANWTQVANKRVADEKFNIEFLDWKKAEHSVPKSTATGPDGIPIEIINHLGPAGQAHLYGAIERAIKSKRIPAHWRESRMSLIYKGKGERDKASSYRPITVTSVLYRLAIQAIKAELLKWVESNGILGELQNGFRPGRRLEDNLFVITQTIEISAAQGRPTWLLFLDIKGAYDNVDRGLLWHILEEEGIGSEFVGLLRAIYEDNKAHITWEGRTYTEPVYIRRGLKQGCPLSPLLFTLYIRGMERRLEESGLGFDLSHRSNGVLVEQRIPGLMYADDIVLLADNAEELQKLADICGDEATYLGLHFNPQKSGVMVFNEEAHVAPIRIQQEAIPLVNKYKYLGIWLNEGKGYLNAHEEHLKLKGRRNAAVMKHRALWGHNKYEVVRGIWKGVMVPALTFSNAVLCLKSDILSGLEVNQKAVGRLALGAHSKTTNEAVQGDMGWASFEAREAQSKIRFEERLRHLDEKNWAARVHRYLYLKSVDTQWRKRTRKLATKYNLTAANKQRGPVKKQVRETETLMWKERMEKKGSLGIYKASKQEIRKENFYDNNKGSALLFEARAGCLRTLTYRSKYSSQDETCVGCGINKETIDHIVMECQKIQPDRNGGKVTLPEALGFAVDGSINWSAVGITKQRLEYWWRKSREVDKITSQPRVAAGQN